MEETIIELRGNGVVMTVYEIDKETLDFLQGRASGMGEDLSQLWFDPFFWHPPEMYEMKQSMKIVGEYRGLMNDDISFMEIRRNGKKRKKYLVKELLGEGQLFPMVNVEALKTTCLDEENHVIIELNSGAGCLGKYVCTEMLVFNLSKSLLRSFKTTVGEFYLLSLLDSVFSIQKDDFLIRGQYLIYSDSSINVRS